VKQEIREFLWVATPKILGGGLQLLFGLILLRYLGPSEYGTLAVCLSAVLLADAVLGAGTDMGVLRLAPLYEQHDPLRSLQIQKAAWALKLAGTCILVIVILAGRPLTQGWFQQPGEQYLLLLTVVSLLGLLALRSAQMYFQVRRAFAFYGAIDLLHSLLKFGGITAVVLLWVPSPARVLAVYALAPLVVGVAAAWTVKGLLRGAPLGLPALRELWGLIRWYLLTVALGTVITRMDLFLVSLLGGVAEAGIFSAAQTVVLVPLLIGAYLAVVFSPRIMPLWKEGRFEAVYLRFQSRLGLTCVVAYLGALLGIGRLGELFFPASFQRATGVILLLLPAALAALYSFPWTVPFLLFARPRFLLAFDGSAFPFLVVLYAWAIREHGAAGAAVVSSGFAIFKAAVMQFVAWSTLQSGFPSNAPMGSSPAFETVRSVP